MIRKITRNILLVALITLIFVLILFVIRIFAKDISVDDMNYLFVGVDDAGDNTDVLAIVSIKDNKLSILQIPRDTYLNFGSYQNKINQCYSYFKSKDKNEKVAMSKLADLVSRQLGVRLDGFVGIKTNNFVAVIDSLGGISIKLNRELNISVNGVEHKYPKGENIINGAEALAIVRHRSSYKGGDLERLEVQRCVYRGIIETLFAKCTNRQIVSVARQMSKSIIVDVPIKDAFALLSRRSGIDYSSTHFDMLKGVATKDERGIWYYALKRRQNEDLLKMLYGVEPYMFDKNKLFMNSKNNKFIEIYNS